MTYLSSKLTPDHIAPQPALYANFRSSGFLAWFYSGARPLRRLFANPPANPNAWVDHSRLRRMVRGHLRHNHFPNRREFTNRGRNLHLVHLRRNRIHFRCLLRHRRHMGHNHIHVHPTVPHSPDVPQPIRRNILESQTHKHFGRHNNCSCRRRLLCALRTARTQGVPIIATVRVRHIAVWRHNQCLVSRHMRRRPSVHEHRVLPQRNTCDQPRCPVQHHNTSRIILEFQHLFSFADQ